MNSRKKMSAEPTHWLWEGIIACTGQGFGTGPAVSQHERVTCPKCALRVVVERDKLDTLFDEVTALSKACDAGKPLARNLARVRLCLSRT